MASFPISAPQWQADNYQILRFLECELGWSFSAYSVASLERQIHRVAQDICDGDSASLLRWLQFRPYERARLLRDALTVNVTDLFRDPDFFRDLTQRCFAYLSEFPTIRIWVAGCSTGEEAYSLAILLAEAGLIQRCQILATDLDMSCLRQARSGVLKSPLSREVAERYRQSGGRASLLEYFRQSYGLAKLQQELLERICFVQHGLPGAIPMQKVQMVSCRNVMIYFNHQMKAQALDSFYDALIPKGFLCLGDKESIEYPKGVSLRELSKHRIYQLER